MCQGTNFAAFKQSKMLKKYIRFATHEQKYSEKTKDHNQDKTRDHRIQPHLRMFHNLEIGA